MKSTRCKIILSRSKNKCYKSKYFMFYVPSSRTSFNLTAEGALARNRFVSNFLFFERTVLSICIIILVCYFTLVNLSRPVFSLSPHSYHSINVSFQAVTFPKQGCLEAVSLYILYSLFLFINWEPTLKADGALFSTTLFHCSFFY